MEKELKIIPVRSYRNPKYPIREDVLRNPGILKTAVPRRWSAKPALCMMLAFTVTSGLCSCAEPQGTLQIPVFEHGTGRGSYGCDSVTPPVFLSEEEAVQVIREEALLQGVDFSGDKSITGKFPATNLYGDKKYKRATWKGTLELDGYDEKLGVGFEYVSRQDVTEWQKAGDLQSTVEFYDMKGTAERLAGAVKDTAVFYDPAADWEAFEYGGEENEGISYQQYAAQYEAGQKEKMREQLRGQVRDFLSWLAGQGII